MSDFSLEQLSNVLSVTDGKLRYWQRIGLFPRRSEGYDWSDLQRAKLLSRLTAEGVPATRLVPYSPLLEGHDLHGYSRALVVDDDEGAREVESGQFLLEFTEPEEPAQLHYLPQADEWERQVQVALEQDRTEDALELAKLALETELDDVIMLNNVGLLFMDLGELELAVSTLRRSCQNIDSGPRQFFNLAHALESAGDPEGAIEALEQALILDPDFSAARFNLAYACETLGYTGKAFLHWKAFLDRHPQGEDADRIRTHLATHYGGTNVVPLRSTR